MLQTSLSDRILLLKSLHSLNFQDESASHLEKIVKSVKGNELETLSFLKLLVPCVTSRNGLKNLSYLFVRYTSDALPGILKNESRSSEARRIVKDFWALCFCQVPNLPSQIRGRVRPDLDFIDILPSLASVYIDLSIATFGNQEKIKKASRKLYSSLMLDLNTRCVKTALLEVSLCTSQGARLLWPLLRKVLLEPPETVTPLDYLLHTVALRRWMMASVSLTEAMQTVRPPKAPKQFVEWLSPLWPRASEYFPLDKSLKGRRVTEVMLSLDKAAVEELIDVFSECLWSTQQRGHANKAGGVSQDVPMETEDQADQLFVIDKAGASVVADTEKEPKAKRRKRDLSVGHSQSEELGAEADDNSRKMTAEEDDNNREMTAEEDDDNREMTAKAGDNSREMTAEVDENSREMTSNEFIDFPCDEGEEVGFDRNPSPVESENNGEDEEEIRMVPEDGSEDDNDDDEDEEEEEEMMSEEGSEGDDDDDDNDDEGGDNDSKDVQRNLTSDASIAHSDNTTIYHYRDEGSYSQTSDTSKHNLRSNSHSIKSQQDEAEPRVKTIDGMEVTVFTASEGTQERSEETKRRMKSYMDVLRLEEEEAPSVGENVSHNLRAIRQSIDAKGHSKSQDASLFSSDSEVEDDTKSEQEGALKWWLRSPHQSHMTPTKAKGKSKSSTEERTPVKQQTSSGRKSAADFFSQSEDDAFTSISSPKRKSQSPRKMQSQDDNVSSVSSPKKASQSPRKMPCQDENFTSISSSKGKSQSPRKILSQDVNVTGKSSPQRKSQSAQKMPSPMPGKSPLKPTGSSIRKQTKKVDTPSKTYYLRNLTEDLSETSMKKSYRKKTVASLDHDVTASSPELTALKRKRTSSEQIVVSPKKSPAGRRKSLRSASKPKAKCIC